MRSRLPARRTVPSRIADTLSRAPSSRTSSRRPLSANTDVRDATWRPSTLLSAVISSSVIPSLKYSFSGSALALTNGSTAMVRASRMVPAPAAGMTSGTGATSASANSVIVAKRSAGDLASARSSARSTASGTFGRRTRTEAGASIAWRAIVARAPVPANGGSPASISYSTQARLYWSLRPSSAGSALACSGLM